LKGPSQSRHEHAPNQEELAADVAGTRKTDKDDPKKQWVLLQITHLDKYKNNLYLLSGGEVFGKKFFG